MSGSSASVPTMDAFNAVVSRVDALANRVTTLEHGTPPPPPPPPPGKTPSADGTAVTSTTGEIVDGKGRTFKLVGPASNYQISTDGTVSGGLVVRLYAKGQLCYQENANHNWWVMPAAATSYGDSAWVAAQNPTGVTPPPPPPPPPVVTGVPKQASDVGFTKLTHGPKVTLGQNWKVSQPTARQNSDGSVFLSEDSYHYNESISTTNQGGNFAGVAFGGGGYFEVDMSIAGSILGWGKSPSNSGWPAWWANNIEGIFSDVPNPRPDKIGIEFDAAEFLDATGVPYNAGIILWSGDGRLFNNSEAGQANGIRVPSGTNFGQRHKYGWLWVPATSTTKGYLKNYFDGVQVGLTYTWNKYQQGAGFDQAKADPWAVLDMCQMRLLIGSNQENPMTVHTITVWQKDDSGNRRVGVPLPA